MYGCMHAKSTYIHAQTENSLFRPVNEHQYMYNDLEDREYNQ